MKYLLLVLLLTACGKQATPQPNKHFDRIEEIDSRVIGSSAYWVPLDSQKGQLALVSGISFAEEGKLTWFCEGKVSKARGTLPNTPHNLAIARERARNACTVPDEH